MKIRKIERRGQVEWMVDHYVSGKRIRRFFDTKTAAENEARTMKDDQKHAGDRWTLWTSERRSELIRIVDEIETAGLTLRKVWDRYRETNVVVDRKTLGPAIKEVVNTKIAANRTDKYTDNLRWYLETFAKGREGMFVDEITTELIEKWFAERREAPSSQACHVARLGAAFEVWRRRGWVKSNPCRDVERVTIRYKAPQIFPVNHVKRILFYCWKRDPEILPWAIMVMLCGVRHEEWEKMHWRDVDVATGRITVDEKASKVHRQRHIDVLPSAREWLKLCQPSEPDETLNVYGFRNKRRKMIRLLRLDWKQDIMRHTCASYMLAQLKNASEVSLLLGNSPAVLLRHYRALVTPEKAAEFWAILPNRPV